MIRLCRLLLSCVLVLTAATGGALLLSPSAAADQHGVGQITLNPGGGILPDGSDGVRFTVNADLQQFLWLAGPDEVQYRGTTQYCCSGAAPMLNIGGQLFGQGGPAYGWASSWASLEILSTSGATTVGARTGALGDARASVRYTALRNGLTYVMDRTVTYTYPNDYVTEDYSFTIPEGNTDVVKFYQGGDTAPGSSDGAYGMMLTEPVRAAISINRDSQIMLGYREVASSKPFDGAHAAHYSSPYGAVHAGQDIGFVVDTGFHDAGLMVQWNLGTTPGIQTATMESFASRQGVNLSAALSTTLAATDEVFSIDVSVVNTDIQSVSDVAYSFTLPQGLVQAGPVPDSSCPGSVSSVDGTVTLVGGVVPDGGNCVLRVPVRAPASGTYTVTSASFTDLNNATNVVGTQSVVVVNPPAWATQTLYPSAVGAPFHQQLLALGSGSISYSIADGALPAGLTLTAAGIISGTPEAVGPYSVTVRATGQPGATTRTFTGNVEQGSTTVSGTATPSVVYYGDATTLTVAGLPATATGAVTFRAGGLVLCSLEAASTTTCTTSSTLSVGAYDVTVTYAGDANWQGSASSVGVLTVQPAPSAVTGSLAASEVAFGQSTAVDVTVTPADATGTVVVGTAGQTWCTLTLPAETCTIPGDLPPGEHSITLAYGGDGRYQAAANTAGPLTVVRAATAPDAVSPVLSVHGTPAELSLTDLPAGATGTVSFTLGSVELCSYTIPGAQGCTAPADLPAGEHDVLGAYSGDAFYEPATAPLQLVIDQLSTAVAADDVHTVHGRSGNVVFQGLPASATGTVRVTLDGAEICDVAVAEGSCTVGGDIPAGEHDLIVTYSGDVNHLGSVTVVQLLVERAEVALDSVPASSVFGDDVTLEISGVGVGGAGLDADATGTVTISSGDDVLCTIDVSSDSTCSITGPAAGEYSLALHYSGDANFAPAEATGTLVVARATSQVTTATSLEGTHGQPLTVEAGGLPLAATGEVVIELADPEDAVTMALAAADATELCRGPVIDGEAFCVLPADLAAGDHLLVVTYTGDDNHEGSHATVALLQHRAPVELELIDVTSPEGVGVELLLAGLPSGATGTVDVMVAGTTVCTFPAGDGGCRLPAAQAAGTHELTVTYSGDANFTSATADAMWTVVAVPAKPVDPPVTPVPSKPAPPEVADRPGLPDTGQNPFEGPEGSALVGVLLLTVAALAILARRARAPQARRG